MIKDIAKRIEVASNVAIIVVALLLGVTLIRYYFFPNRVDSHQGIIPGTRIDVQGIDWTKSDRTLLLALQKGCHFCTESAPFYQKLVSQALMRKVRIIAVLPQEVGVSQEYLGALNVQIGEIRQMPLDALKISGTPTVILVDSRGFVIRSWIGKLPPEAEAEVIQML